MQYNIELTEKDAGCIFSKHNFKLSAVAVTEEKEEGASDSEPPIFNMAGAAYIPGSVPALKFFMRMKVLGCLEEISAIWLVVTTLTMIMRKHKKSFSCQSRCQKVTISS
jgi:hypothetical protein